MQLAWFAQGMLRKSNIASGAVLESTLRHISLSASGYNCFEVTQTVAFVHDTNEESPGTVGLVAG